MSDRVDKIVGELARGGPRKCSAETQPGAVLFPPDGHSPALTPEELSNVRTKEAFEDKIADVGIGDYSVRDLALFFGVKRSKLYERMCRRRIDLAPLPEWFEKLERHAAWKKLNAEFAKRSA